MKDYSYRHQLTNRQHKVTRKSLILLLILTTMMIAAVIITAQQTTQSTPQQNTNHGNPTREGAPPAGNWWAAAYGGSNSDIVYSAQQTADGGYILAGFTRSFGSGGQDAWLLKLNSTGGIAWQKTYGDSGNEVAWSVQQTSDGGYIVAAGKASISAGDYDAWVLKLDSAGSVTWQKTYGGPSNDEAYAVQQTTDGGYIVAGYTNSFGVGGGYADAWVLKLDSAGSVTWQETFGGGGNDWALSVQQTADGDYIVAGYTESIGAGHYDYWVIRLSSTGSLTWQRTYGYTSDDLAECIQQTSDGGYIVAGYTVSFGAGGSDVWVLKLNSTGGITWQKTYGGSSNDYAYYVRQTVDGGYIVAGATASFGAGSIDVWVLKLDSTGGVIRQKAYGGSGNEWAYYVQETSDGGYIVAGKTASFGAGLDDVWVVKLGVGGFILWDAGSGASTHTTSVDPASSSVVPSTTSLTPISSTSASANTAVTPQNTNATVSVQATAKSTIPYWAKTYGGSGDEGATSVQQTADGGYIVAGGTLSFGAGGEDVWLLKLDSSGSVTWQKTYGGAGTDEAYSVQQTADEGYIVAGSTTSFGAGGKDIWVLKLDPTGEVTWQKAYGASTDDYAYSVQQTSDGGYIVAGSTWAPVAGGYDVWLLKLNSTGGVTWQKTYGGSSNNYGQSVQQTVDGGYIVAGRINAYADDTSDFWILKLNSTGSVTWQKRCGGSNNDDVPNSIQQTSDGGYIVAGYTWSFGPGPTNFWVLKLNSTGSVTWQKTYGGSNNENARSVQQTSDGGYIVAGSTASSGAGGTDVWVLKLNSTGSVTWQKTYGGSTNDWAYSVQQTSDGCYVVAGYASSIGAGSGDFWVVKLGIGGEIVFDAGSGASTHTTSVTPTDSNATISTPSITPLSRPVTITSTTVTSQNTSATVKVQSSGDTTPPATILDLASGNPTATSITLTWTAPGDDGMSGNATGYLAKYSTSGPINAANWDSATTYTQTWTPAKNGTTETRTVSGLKNDTRYWFAVEAYDKVPNYGGVSNSPSGMTTDAFPPATITNLATSNATAYSITLTWTAPGDSGMRGNATGYVVKYSTSGQITELNWASATTYTQTWTPAKNGTADSHKIIGLTPNTQYWFAIKAYDEVPNYSGVSNSPSGTTTTPPPSAYWAKTYGGSGSDKPLLNAIQQTADGGYIVAGSTYSFGAGGYDAWVLKLDSTGSVAWQKTYGGTSSDAAYSVQQTSDGGYIVAGSTYSFGAGGYDAWVLKLDSTGGVTWQKTYGGTSSDIAYSVQQTSDGGYIVGGETQSFGAGGYYTDFWVLKLDSTGGVAWQKTYGGSNFEEAYSVQQTSDGGYIVAGDTQTFGAGGYYDAWVLKLNSTGGVAWQKNYGGNSYDYVYSVQQTADGGYIVAGYTYGVAAGGPDAWVLKLNSTGSVTWQKTYGGSSYDDATSVQQTQDGGYIVAGTTISFGAGSWDFWVLKLDSTGSVAWQKTYGGTNSEVESSVKQTLDGGYIVTGYTGSFGAGGYDHEDFWVVKLGSGGEIVWDAGSGASTTTTSVTPADFSAVASTTSVTPANSAATITSTTVTAQNTSATVKVQSPPPAPTIDQPGDITYTVGQTGNSITWQPSSQMPSKYSITRNGTIVASGSWSGTSITQSVDGLSPGRYIYTCSVNDTLSRSTSSSVQVLVLPLAPTIDQPSNIVYTIGQTGNAITWHPSSQIPDRYSITRNGTIVASGSWSGTPITQSVDGLSAGTYIYTCTVNDTLSRSTSSTVQVLVLPPAPTIDQPSAITYVAGATGNTITWHPSSEIPDHYRISMNGSSPTSHSWNGSTITYNVDGWSAGTHSVNCTVYDTQGRSASSTVTVTVSAPAGQGIPVIIIVGAVAVAAVVLVILIVIITKRKK